MTAGGMLILGIIVGIALALFCVFVISAKHSNGRIADAELEAWRDWLEEREKWARRQAFEEEFREMGAVELPMAEWHDAEELPMAEHNGKGVVP